MYSIYIYIYVHVFGVNLCVTDLIQFQQKHKFRRSEVLESGII